MLLSRFFIFVWVTVMFQFQLFLLFSIKQSIAIARTLFSLFQTIATESNNNNCEVLLEYAGEGYIEYSMELPWEVGLRCVSLFLFK